MGHIQAVIFDLDGVITDTAEYHYLAWKKLADDLGIPMDRSFNERLKGVGRKESLEKILEHGNKQLSEQEKDFYATKKNEHYKTFIQDITPNDLLPGILEFMKEIKESGIQTALASASKNAKPVIRRLEVEQYLDTVVDAAQVENGKPDPEIFLKGADQLSVDPAYCVGVEDAQAGVQAIKAAGMYAVGIGSAKVLTQADWVVQKPTQLSWEELKRRLEM
ncbi:beta-phosphoglucomutase [Pontibacillus yanchengensis]|uniref:Beta-phosphoglucomutase n=2 Tax=Pontibacillus yanchengensis TaxID=462910 RepID=A0A6I5A6G2_9BACI|nr:beta-phosphoglucomutase [Pontibacillus yanchengensis]MYL35848.1 beta-phosphoglucomutase [Pontibacillus yanchengensis]MYL55567.1 beta-phosphoglucomutase [Pontibacillus yanchengensis]